MAYLNHSPVVRFAALTLLLLGITAPAAAQSETIEYYGLDALGSVRVIFNAQGAVVDRMDYGPFGENLRAAIKFPVEQFAQLARDAESGQDYAQARNYSTSTGRFTRVDPVYAGLFEPQKWNRYSYAVNNPVRFVDVEGTDPQDPCSTSSTTFCTNVASNTFLVNSESQWASTLDGMFGRSRDRDGFNFDNLQAALDALAANLSLIWTPEEVIKTLDDVHDAVNPTKDFRECTQNLSLPSCGTVVLAASPGTKAVKYLPRLVAKFPMPVQRIIAYPTKRGAAGHQQFQDAGGRFLSHIAPLWRTPHQAALGAFEGLLAARANGTLPGSASKARTIGQWIGQTAGNFWPW